MATFESTVADIVNIINSDIAKGVSQIEVNLELTIPSDINIAKDLHHALIHHEFNGYVVNTCRIREIVDFLFVNREYVDRDILVNLNIELNRVEQVQ